MVVELQQVDIVVQGRFNPYIIQPKWLMAQTIVPEPSEEKVVIEVPIGGRAIAFNFEIDGLRWHVDESRLTVLSTKGQNPGDKVRSVIEKLPHTPLIAVGHNFRYSSTRADWGAGLPRLGEIGFDEVSQLGDIKMSRWATKIERHEGLLVVVDLTEDIVEERVVIKFNYHREANDPPAVGKVLDKFDNDLDDSRHVLECLGVKLDS